VSKLNRQQAHRPGLHVTLLALTLLVASDAMASEGSIVLLPTKESAPLLISLLVFFILLIWPVNKLLIKPLLGVIDAREDRITGTRARAEKLSADADQVLERYESSIRAAHEEAQRDRKQALTVARSESGSHTTDARAGAEKEIEAARAQITGELSQARSALRTQAEQLATEAASTVLGRDLS
jgi:F-type H+-transporting ATPase subunit b